MKIKLLIFTSLVSILVSACSSDFEKSMKDGKSALKEEKFQQALQHFDYALIDKPNDEDALDLKERTEKSLKQERMKERDENFRGIFDPIYERLRAFDADVDLRNNPLEINKETAQKSLETAQKIRLDLDSVSEEWMYSGGDKEKLYWNLSEAADGLVSAYEYIIDPPTPNPAGYTNTRAGGVEAYYDNPINAINTEFIRYTTSLDSYKQKTSPAE